jgi:hypothetical protein
MMPKHHDFVINAQQFRTHILGGTGVAAWRMIPKSG